MKDVKKYKNKKILILGLAKSGLNAAKLLYRLGAFITVNDYKDLSEDKNARELLNLGIKVISGNHPEDLLDEDFELIVKNPGIPYSNPVIKKAIAKNIEIVTETEIALAVNESELIAITGTNGKTTTATLINDLLNIERNKGSSFAAGNIGAPMSGVIQKTDSDDDIVVELSSFQLLGTPSLKPSIALITNVYTAHLDYHETRDNYVNAKMNITNLQNEDDYLIYNYDSTELRELVAGYSNATLIPFSRKQFLTNGSAIKNDMIYFDNEPIVALNAIKLPGKHNIENVLGAVAVAKLKGRSNKSIQSVLEGFKGVKHRGEFVSTWKDRTFINDSKATNSLATKNAIDGFEAPVVLLAGGLDRGDDFKELMPSFKKNVKALVTFGETSEKLLEAGKRSKVPQLSEVKTLKEAVFKGIEFSEKEDIILFSPACASWDQYINFEVRGDAFVKYVSELMQSTVKEV